MGIRLQTPDQPTKARLRLAAMAGHRRRDKIAARRAAYIDLLADGRPQFREEFWAAIAAQLRGMINTGLGHHFYGSKR